MYVFYTAQRTRLPIRACVKIIVLFSVTMAPFAGGRRITEECLKLSPPLPLLGWRYVPDCHEWREGHNPCWTFHNQNSNIDGASSLPALTFYDMQVAGNVDTVDLRKSAGSLCIIYWYNQNYLEGHGRPRTLKLRAVVLGGGRINGKSVIASPLPPSDGKPDCRYCRETFHSQIPSIFGANPWPVLTSCWHAGCRQ